MKVYATIYKTYDGARKRMLHEKACALPRNSNAVWDVRWMGDGFYRVVRISRTEYEREMAITAAMTALGLSRTQEN